MRATEVSQAKVKATVQKTGKTYYRTMDYAKKVTFGKVGQPKTQEFFLREGRGWRKVTKEEYEAMTSEESAKKLYERLERELRERVEQEMKVTFED